MAFDERLAQRVREALGRKPGITEKRMFGGLCFLVNGNMCCGIEREKLMVRVGPEHYAAALMKPHARPMDFTGRPLRGFVFVMPQGVRDQRTLTRWVDLGLRHATSLPAKRKPAGVK